jgi:hypothetical protein
MFAWDDERNSAQPNICGTSKLGMGRQLSAAGLSFANYENLKPDFSSQRLTMLI